MPVAGPVRFPSLEGLRAFEVAARLGSFEKAAVELHVTPSAVSKRVSAAEEVLGQALFRRSSHALALTPVGRDYLAQVAPVLQMLMAIPLHQRAPASRERVRVTAPPTFARQILVPQLRSFAEQYPQVELEVTLSPTVLDSPPTEADVEVRNGDATQAGATQLMTDVVLPMAAPEWIDRAPPLPTPADLSRVPLLRTPLEQWRPWFQAAGLDWPEPESGTKLVDLGLLIEATVAGQGVGLLRPSLASNWLVLGRLKPLFTIEAVPANQYYLLPWVNKGPAGLFAQWLRHACDASVAQARATLRAAA